MSVWCAVDFRCAPEFVRLVVRFSANLKIHRVRAGVNMNLAPAPRCMNHPPHPCPVVTLGRMARTVKVHDPATDTTFNATRTQWERLHAPAGRELVADENGNPPISQKAKPKPADPAAEQE